MLRTIQQKSKDVRERWGKNVHFIASLIAATTGMTDVLSFPVDIMQKKRGYLIAFLISMVLIGIPLVFMELSLGQFTSAGPTNCWHFSPVFRGVGFGSVTLAAVATLSYAVRISYPLLYTFNAMYSEMPWAKCEREWASNKCTDFLNLTTAAQCEDNGWLVNNDGACYNDSVSPKNLKALWNASCAAQNEIRRVLPASDYWKNYVLGIGKEDIGFYNLGKIHWDLATYVFLTWGFIFLSLYWGLKSIVGVLYFSFICVLAALVFQLITSSLQDGAINGIHNFFTTDINSLTDVWLWVDATIQVFFTLGINSGKLVCIASFSDFQGDTCFYAFLSAAVNIIFSIISGCVTFAVLGTLSKKLQVPLDEAFDEDIGFVVYAHALAHVPGGAAWAVMFFFMLYMLGLNLAVIAVHTIVSSLCDVFPLLSKHKQVVLASTCAVFFFSHFPMVTDGGYYIVCLIEEGCFSFNLFVLSFLQSVSVAWVYGAGKFAQDISFMVGCNVCKCLSWSTLKYYFIVCWSVLCPCVTVVAGYKTLQAAIKKANSLRGFLQLATSVFIILPVPLLAAHAVYKRYRSASRGMFSAFLPSSDWGPILPMQRNLWLSVHKFAPGSSTAVDRVGWSEYRYSYGPSLIFSNPNSIKTSEYMPSDSASAVFNSQAFEHLFQTELAMLDVTSHECAEAPENPMELKGSRVMLTPKSIFESSAADSMMSLKSQGSGLMVDISPSTTVD